MTDDIYGEYGTPKYQDPHDIYDAIVAMASGQEINILSEMFSDISWENQDYYYTDNGERLKERWEEMTHYLDNMWLMGIAAWQMENHDANDMIYDIIYDEDFSKKVGLKKIFVDTVLDGAKEYYAKVIDSFGERLGNLMAFSFFDNSVALQEALEDAGISYSQIKVNRLYSEFTQAVYNKMKGFRLEEERQLIVESRAMLTAYDDFMFGLRSNQELYNQQENAFKKRKEQLEEGYQQMVHQLMLAAQAQGVQLELPKRELLELDAGIERQP